MAFAENLNFIIEKELSGYSVAVDFFAAETAVINFSESARRRIFFQYGTRSVELENFTFKITNLKAGYVYVDFAPKNSSMTYFFNLVVKEDAKGKSDDEIFASDIENIENIASQQGISSAELLSSELKSGNVKWRFTGLMQSSDYTIYAYGLDADGNRLRIEKSK